MPTLDGQLAADRDRALDLTPVSRETLARLDRFVDLLLLWQKTTNLIAPSTIQNLWTRHVADSLQILDLAPDALHWVDFGSGGGFPGVVLACGLADRPGTHVHLIESNTKKAAFLREACRLTAVPANVHAERIERFVDRFDGRVDIVTARALAPLSGLLTLSAPILCKKGVQGLFLKGRDAELELRDAGKSWMMETTLIPSRTDPNGRIIRVGALRPRAIGKAAGQTDEK
jgi:16S rRNA (guanine527-N7)-methyltransferase